MKSNIRSHRSTALLAGAVGFGLISSLLIAHPAVARSSEAAVPSVQTLSISEQAVAPALELTTFTSTAPDYRALIVNTAMGYLGTRYALGGASHSGIDCSGLTMQAYAAAGIALAHYVPTQDAVGTRIAAQQALPGDLIVFNDEAHVAIYLGNGQLVAAPAPGRQVEVENLGDWSGVGYHFTRILQS